MDCLDEQTLLQYAGGSLDPALVGPVDAHIDACRTCAALAAFAVEMYGADTESDDEGDGAEPDAADPANVDAVPNVIGRYLTIGRLGSGGMGTVYSAYDPDLQRKVALKVLRPQFAERGDNLRQEAQALARLAHPNVVQAFGVGVLDGATPFLVMELVDGVDLRVWKTQAPRTDAEIIDAYLQAAEGLAAAHAMGLVHCDFKPENVLVGSDGCVRVTDFGLAKLAATAETIDAENPSHSAPSRATHVMGTPAYMAPEQREGRRPDAKADQYSFCIALWEALAGKHPRDGTLGERENKIAPGVRRALVRGLAHHPEDRWPSMRTLVDALRKKPRWRVWRWVVPGLVAATAAGGLALGWVVLQPDACDRARSRGANAWKPQVQESLVASGVSQKSVDALVDWAARWKREATAACPDDAARRNLGVARCLETAASSLGELTAMLPQLEEAFAIEHALIDPRRCRSARAPHHRLAPQDVRRLTATRADLARARAVDDAGQHEDALSALDSIWVDAQDIGHPPLMADVQLARGDAARRAGAYELARHASNEAYLLGTAHGLDWVAATAATTLFFVVGSLADDVEGAVPWLRRAEAAIEQLPPDMRPKADARLAITKGHWHRHAGRLAEAQVELERAVAFIERARGPDHESLAFPLADLGSVLTYSDPGAAQVHLERAVAIAEAAYEVDDTRLAHVLSLLGAHHSRLGHTNRALELQRRVLPIVETAYGASHDDVAGAVYNIGVLLDELGQDEEAAASYARARDIWTTTRGPDHPLVGTALGNLASLAYEAGDYTEAERGYQKALLVYDRAVGADSEHHLVPLAGLAEVSIETGQASKAVAYASRALAVALAEDATAEHRALVRYRHARALWLAGKRPEATREAERALQDARAQDDPLEDDAEAAREIEGWLSERAEQI